MNAAAASAVVIGIGNVLLSDEGVGVHAIRALMDRYAFPEGVLLIDGGNKGLELLPYIEGDHLMLIDAVDFGEPPGTVRVMEGDEIHAFLDMKFSVHQIGVPDLLFAAMLTGVLPLNLCLVGIQPESLEAGLELTGTVRGKMDELLGLAVEELRSWGIEVKEAASGVPCDSL